LSKFYLRQATNNIYDIKRYRPGRVAVYRL